MIKKVASNKLFLIVLVACVLAMSICVPILLHNNNSTASAYSNQSNLQFNQLIKPDIYTNKNTPSFTINNNNDGSFTIVRLDESELSQYIPISYEPITIINTHKYYISVNNDIGVPYFDFEQGDRVWNNGVFTGRTNLIYMALQFVNYEPLNTPFTYYPILIDLTEMFGVGNEPTTVAEVQKYIPDGIYLPYNTGISAINIFDYGYKLGFNKNSLDSYNKGYNDAINNLGLVNTVKQEYQYLISNLVPVGDNSTVKFDYPIFYNAIITGSAKLKLNSPFYSGSDDSNLAKLHFYYSYAPFKDFNIDVGYFDVNNNFIKLTTTAQLETGGEFVNLKLPNGCDNIGFVVPQDKTWWIGNGSSFNPNDNIFFVEYKTLDINQSIKNSFDDGLNQGYNKGYQDGKTVGYNQGSKDAGEYSFLNLMTSTIDAPINAVMQMFDFNILGTNMKTFVYSLLTVCVILLVAKILLGRF